MSTSAGSNRDATHLSLGLRDVGSVMEKLRWEVHQFLIASEQTSLIGGSDDFDPRSPTWLAINAAGTAWSLLEWAFRDLERFGRVDDLLALLEVDTNAVGSTRKAKLDACKTAIRSRVPEINYCFHITHAAKHATLLRMDDGLSANASTYLYQAEDGVGLRIVQHGIVTVKGDTMNAAFTVHVILRDVLLWWDHAVGQLGLRSR